MFLSVNIFYFKLIIFFGLIAFILGECYIELSTTSDINPRFYRYVGTHKIKVNTGGAATLQLREKQELEVYCDSYFERPLEFNKESKLFVKCSQGYIYISADANYKTNYNRFSSRSSDLKCSFEKWNLYEAAAKLNWCPSNVTLYIVARSELWNPITSPFNKLAGICYDIENLSFQSVYYALTPNGTKDVQPTVLRDFSTPGLKIDDIKETFGVNNFLENKLAKGQFQNWLSDSKYEFDSIIQHTKLVNSFNDEFSALLEFMWWPNLRLYNWKRYIDALEDHVENDDQAYDILAGVSGTLEIPILQSCQENYTLKEVLPKSERKVPLYVWNYLLDRSNSSNKLVVIGFNSPFYEFYSPTDVIFCPDKCQEITWLKKAMTSFRYNIMGIVFCCSIEDVRSSKRLSGFPEKSLKPDQKFNRKKFRSEDRTAHLNDRASVTKHEDYEVDLDLTESEENKEIGEY